MEKKRDRDVVIEIDGVLRRVPEKITVKEALWEVGYRLTAGLPAEGEIYAPCGVGACWDCAVQIDGEVQRACVTEAREGMKIRTHLPSDWVPRRVIGPTGGLPHGGVGTPWEVRKNSTSQFLEICCLVAGCNFRCPQCHNWMVTHMGNGQAYTPTEAAEMLTKVRHELRIDRFCLSGGEITLNRPWLMQLLEELKRLNPGPETRLHISTNGSLLTPDYIDELVDTGLTDFGIDLKGLRMDTFMGITGIRNRELARRCRDNAWNAVAYIAQKHRARVFLGVGVPYNGELISMEEISQIGRQLSSIDRTIQTTAMAYFDGGYRRRLMWPGFDEMKTVHHLLEQAGLATVQAFATEFIPPSRG
ncbi:MAG: radical SAM protein [Chloroflexota bacterium]|nr:radical SAM protein [Chloroflexota bacterium]